MQNARSRSRRRSILSASWSSTVEITANVWLEPTANPTKTCLRVALNETSLAAPSGIIYETPTYLDWLHGRLQGGDTTETPWLADHTLEQVLAASEMIGGVLQHGHKVKLTKLSPAETEEATDIGFSIYSEGPEAVEEALGSGPIDFSLVA